MASRDQRGGKKSEKDAKGQDLAQAEEAAPLTDEQLQKVAGGGGWQGQCTCRNTGGKLVINPACPMHGGRP
jgi:hypothetical protein